MANVKTVARKTLGWVSRLISIAALIAVFILSGMLLRSIAQTKKTQELTSSLQAIRTTAQETNETDWSNGMLAVNPDYKGWLTVYGTTATGPVVQGETNDTYLRTDIYGEHSIPGTLFLDEVCETIQDKASIYKELQFDCDNDKFLFLVTCDYNINNGRMVLAAKRLKKIDENLRS